MKEVAAAHAHKLGLAASRCVDVCVWMFSLHFFRSCGSDVTNSVLQQPECGDTGDEHQVVFSPLRRVYTADSRPSFKVLVLENVLHLLRRAVVCDRELLTPCGSQRVTWGTWQYFRFQK